MPVAFMSSDSFPIAPLSSSGISVYQYLQNAIPGQLRYKDELFSYIVYTMFLPLKSTVYHDHPEGTPAGKHVRAIIYKKEWPGHHGDKIILQYLLSVSILTLFK